jgi:hypothetical protein
MFLVFGNAALGQMLYVSPKADAKGAGTRENPLTLSKAFERATADPTLKEIILADGEYFISEQNIQKPKEETDKIAPLLIHADSAAKPVLHGAVRITEAEAITGAPGLYRVQEKSANVTMWERDTRVRYVNVFTRASAAALTASCFADQAEGWTYFHTSDGKPPRDHAVFLGHTTRGLGIYRPKTTVEGLTFRDYADGLVIHGLDLSVRRCNFDYCSAGIVGGHNGGNYLVEDCMFKDVATGIYNMGKEGIIVRRCRFEKTRDRFMIPVSIYDDMGIRNYDPACGGIEEYNFLRGYRTAIRMKTNGTNAPFIVRHNTIVDCEEGVLWIMGGNGKNDTSYNIIANAKMFVDSGYHDLSLDYNLYWNPVELAKFQQTITDTRGVNRGKFNLLADPRFADPAHGDYRLLPDSPAFFLKDAEGKPAGAFGAAPVEVALAVKPILELGFTADTAPCGTAGALTFDKDPWNGGGTTHVRDLSGTNLIPHRIIGQTKCKVVLRAFDPVGKIIKHRIAVDDQPPKESAFTGCLAVELPDKDGEHRIRCEVQNDRNMWSEPVEAVIRLSRNPPTLAGEPQVAANDNGIIVAFRASEPCFAEVQFGATTNYGHSLACPDLIKRRWDASDGGEWVETWKIPRTEFTAAILCPDVKTKETVHFRLVLGNEAGLKSASPDFTATVKGTPRALYISPNGNDTSGKGLKDAPWKTLQYAADRALPGDRVVLLPGLYPEGAILTHGGVDENARLTIEAESRDAATIDGAAREISLIALERAPFVTFRNLRCLGYAEYGIYAYRSPHTTLESCTLFNGWSRGNGVRANAFFFYSPHSVVTRSLSIGGLGSIHFLKSAGARVIGNTIARAVFTGVGYDFSLADSVQVNNSIFCAGGINMFAGDYEYPAEAKTRGFRSDYNNIGATVLEYNKNQSGAKQLLEKIKAQEFKIDYPAGAFEGSKSIVEIGERYLVFKDWQDKSGQDRHSVFADPKYVKPYALPDAWDWRVKPDSPNIGAGEKGATIGAFEAAK